jgi:hypothetical protein
MVHKLFCLIPIFSISYPLLQAAPAQIAKCNTPLRPFGSGKKSKKIIKLNKHGSEPEVAQPQVFLYTQPGV